MERPLLSIHILVFSLIKYPQLTFVKWQINPKQHISFVSQYLKQVLETKKVNWANKIHVLIVTQLACSVHLCLKVRAEFAMGYTNKCLLQFTYRRLAFALSGGNW